MKKIVQGVGVALLLLFTGCSDLDKPVIEQVEGGEVLVDLNSVTMKGILKGLGYADDSTQVYGYKAYKIPYETTDEEGNRVGVSGLMVVPQGMPEVVSNVLGYSLVSDDHGTIFSNSEAPTEIAKETFAPDGSSVLLTSLGGFVTLQPDYIGFGDSSDHYHPFVLKRSLANATVDFIVAARAFAEQNAIKLNGQLFLTGYSEGGYAAMATLQKIEEEESLEVAMAAPMAGPYAFDAMAMGVLSAESVSVPSFMAEIGYAYAKAYGQEIDTVVNEPYASKLDGLFDGTKVRSEIDAALTTKTTGEDGLFNPTFVNEFFTNDTYWFKEAAQENDVYNWVPQTAVRLVHCEGDSVIPYAITQLTESTMQEMGATNVVAVPVEQTLGLGDVRIDHTECGLLAYKIATGLFAQERNATIGY